jgi:hypothetical protein
MKRFDLVCDLRRSVHDAVEEGSFEVVNADDPKEQEEKESY